MTHDDDTTDVVLLNSGSQYLKNYHKAVNGWIECFIQDQKQHVLNISKFKEDSKTFEINETPQGAPATA